MTEIPGGSFFATGDFAVGTAALPPQYLMIGSMVRISLDDGSIEYGDDYQPDQAARAFWEALGTVYGGALRDRAEKAETTLATVREYLETSDNDGIRTRERALGILDQAAILCPASCPCHPMVPRTEPRRFEYPIGSNAAEIHHEELTREEAMDLVAEVSQQAYQAEDRLAFIAEMCTAAEEEGGEITVGRLRSWLAYTGCGGVLTLPEEAQAALRDQVKAVGTGREFGKTRVVGELVERALARGEHVHTVRAGVVKCESELCVAAPATQASEPETEQQLHARRACPGWEYATTEGQRKQWDEADRPPSDENGDPDPSWERNTDAGRNGWDRFDYTEESYWRRRIATSSADG